MSDTPEISVVIPYYNKWELTHARLMELHTRLAEPVEVCLVNNNSTERDCETGVDWWKKQDKKNVIRYKKYTEKQGFGAAMNAGVKLAHGDILVLLSNDVYVYADFTQEIRRLVETYPHSLIAAELITFDSGWNKFPGEDVFAPYANGWFMACTKEVWKKLGGFDDAYLPYDFEDVDISMKAMSLGFDLVKCKARLHHMGGQTVSEAAKQHNTTRQAQTLKNQAYFFEKWKDHLFLQNYVLSPDRVYELKDWSDE